MSTDPQSPVVVAEAADELQANVILGALEAAGIHAKMVGEFTAGFRAEAPGMVQILVRQEDAEKAKSLLESLPK